MSSTIPADESIDIVSPHHFDPISIPNSDFPSAAVTGRPSLTNDETKLVFPVGTRVESNAITATTQSPQQEEWKAGKQEWLIVLCLGIVSLMVALDATIVVPALPVGPSCGDPFHTSH